MSSPGRNPERKTLRVVVGAVVLAGLGVIVGALLATPVGGDSGPSRTQPASPVVSGTVPATKAQARTAGATAAATRVIVRKKVVKRPVVLQARITTNAISTEPNKGSYVGVRCPAGSKAISGGVFSSYTNLVISHSGTNHPVNGKYTPRIWWVSVTNGDFDGRGDTLSWRGIANCLSPIKLGK